MEKELEEKEKLEPKEQLIEDQLKRLFKVLPNPPSEDSLEEEVSKEFLLSFMTILDKFCKDF